MSEGGWRVEGVGERRAGRKEGKRVAWGERVLYCCFVICGFVVFIYLGNEIKSKLLLGSVQIVERNQLRIIVNIAIFGAFFVCYQL